MSGGGIHIHAAHDHALEHQAEHGDRLSMYIAVFTALLAAAGAVVGYLGGHTQNEALLFKNQAVLLKAHASDQWAFYQAKSTKQHMMELAMDLAPAEQRDNYRKLGERYDSEKKEIKAKAETLDKASDAANDESEHALVPHVWLAQAMSAIQIAIALASVTALTRQRWLLIPAVGAAIIAGGMVTLAYV